MAKKPPVSTRQTKEGEIVGEIFNPASQDGKFVIGFGNKSAQKLSDSIPNGTTLDEYLAALAAAATADTFSKNKPSA